MDLPVTRTQQESYRHLSLSRSVWFGVAGACIAGAALIFGRRAQRAVRWGETWRYEAAIISAYLLLAAAAGTLTEAFTAHPRTDD
ncbi:hypothetical protein [Arthrobacter sp. L77]|uniref:hypothetical protein n=1 Tax=Arthrobacter sp. L77 TaxID=1496689 RepID=UPI0012DFFC1F|nr:hypothetical protein [Arthrobacter sp. L77]